MVQVVPHPGTVAKRFLPGLLEQALEEARLFCQPAESKGEEAEPSQFFWLADLIFQPSGAAPPQPPSGEKAVPGAQAVKIAASA
jgi:hypothetical protein